MCGSNDYQSLKGADFVIISAGISKIPGKSHWTQGDLLPANVKIIHEIGTAIKNYCPGAFIVNITSPLDIMVNALKKESTGLPSSRMCGMPGMMDSARFRRIIPDKLRVSPRDVQGMVIGVYGENMVPLTRYDTVNSISLSEYVRQGWITEQEIGEIAERTKVVGFEVLHLCGDSYAFYSPAAQSLTSRTVKG